METIDLIDANALIKQGNPIVLKKQYKKVCKNVKEMSYKELISHLMKELMGYAMSLTLKNEFNADGLVQTTLIKLIKNKEKLMALEHPVALSLIHI